MQTDITMEYLKEVARITGSLLLDKQQTMQVTRCKKSKFYDKIRTKIKATKIGDEDFYHIEDIAEYLRGSKKECPEQKEKKEKSYSKGRTRHTGIMTSPSTEGDLEAVLSRSIKNAPKNMYIG